MHISARGRLQQQRMPPRDRSGDGSRGVLTPVQTAAELSAALRNPSSNMRIPFVGVETTLRFCGPVRVPAGVSVTLDCHGKTFDLRCPAMRNSMVGANATLTLQSCQTLWPGTAMRPPRGTQAQPGSLIVVRGGSISSSCRVRL